MAFGIETTGFVIKRLQDIKDDIEIDVRKILGLAEGVTIPPDSQAGQLIGAFSKPTAEVWELAQDVYLARNPNAANGVSLDDILALNGLTRLPATATTVVGVLQGDQGTVVLATRRAGITGTANLFSLNTTVTIDKANAVTGKVEVSNIIGVAGYTYTISINGTPYTYIGQIGDVEADVAAGLVVALAGATVLSVTDNFDGTLQFEAVDNETAFSFDVGTKLTIEYAGTPGNFTALETGAIQVLEKTLSTIITPVTGWLSVTNLKSGTVGRPLESDSNARARREASLRVIAGSTIDAIRSRLLQDVDGVTTVLIIENDTEFVVDGQAPHSYRVIVLGGASQDIGTMIWETKPAGIQTVGSQAVNVPDLTGTTQTVYFDRPTNKYLHAKMTIDKNPEMEWPGDVAAAQAISDALVLFGNSLGIGADVLIQRLFKPIYEAVPAIANVSLEIAITDIDPGTPIFVTTNIDIDIDELSQWAESRVLSNITINP